MKLNHLSDDALVASLREHCLHVRRLDARIVAHLVEVEERRLHLKAACSSLFVFCVQRLDMSEGAAFRRITAARLARRFPRLLDELDKGVLHLSTLVLLRDHLTEENLDELLGGAAGKTKREVEELLARRAPRPDVPATIRKLPTRASVPSAAPTTPATGELALALATAASRDSDLTSPPARSPEPVAKPSDSVPVARVESHAMDARQRQRIGPLSESRYKVQLTVSRDLRDKLERATSLMRHRNPSGDLAVVLERALDALLTNLERERLAKTPRPRLPAGASTPIDAAPRAVAAHVRREVYARDGERCTYVDEEGRRCASRDMLELDHVAPRALGGSNASANLRVLCRAHNQLHAEQVFGRDCVERGIHFRQRKSPRPSATPSPTEP